MANVWRLTSEGRAALMDGNNRQTRAIVMRTIAIGDGSGAPSQTETENRTTLRSQRDTGAVGGQTNVAGRIAVRASITPSAAYDVTEVGVFGQIETEAPLLLAYWTDSGRVLVPATQDATTVIAGTLDLAAAAAEVMVTVSPLVSLSAVGAAVDLTDFPDAFVAGGYLRVTSPDPAALENVTPRQVRDDITPGLSALVDGANIAWAVDSRPNAAVVLGGNRTMAAPTGAVNGHYYLLTVQQDANGNRTLAWAADYVFTGIGFNGAPTLAPDANARTKFAFVYEGAKMRCLGRAVGF